MLAYAAIRGGVGGPYTDRLSGLEEWREKAGKWALVYDADAVEEEIEAIVRLPKGVSGRLLSCS